MPPLGKQLSVRLSLKYTRSRETREKGVCSESPYPVAESVDGPEGIEVGSPKFGVNIHVSLSSLIAVHLII